MEPTSLCMAMPEKLGSAMAADATLTEYNGRRPRHGYTGTPVHFTSTDGSATLTARLHFTEADDGKRTPSRGIPPADGGKHASRYRRGSAATIG